MEKEKIIQELNLLLVRLNPLIDREWKVRQQINTILIEVSNWDNNIVDNISQM